MANLTPNLGLFKYDPLTDTNQVFSFEQALNDNWDILDEKCGNARNSIFDFKWSDHELDDMSWLRGDTFSWQPGGVYVTAYNHLVQDVQGITAETETIGSYTITFYRATDGHKICLADQETTIANIYSETGIAWYYILDTTNTQFKLPRTKYGFEGLRTNVGDLIDESLPNITGDVGYTIGTNTNATGAFTKDANTNSAWWQGATNVARASVFHLNASNSSSTYQDNAPVQEQATQMYLYFYVGDYTQSAIEQTAGLNSELFNDKVDKSSLAEVQCVVETYINGTSWYRVYSDGWCEQGGYTTTNGTYAISLLKTMKDTNYYISLIESSNGTNNPAGSQNSIPIKGSCTTNSIYVYINGSSGLGAYWEVKGYIEV